MYRFERYGAVKAFATVALGVSLALLAALPVTAQPQGRGGPPDDVEPGEKELRVAQYNMLDVRTEDVKRDDNPRLRELAATIQRKDPDVILLNELTYDEQGAPDVEPGEGEGQNARRFAENYLAKPQEPGLKPIRYEDFMRPSNTGIPSGYDLNNDGEAVTEYPEPPGTAEDGTPGAQTPGGQAYGDDSYGFGIFPGQYGMGLLVKPQYKIQQDEVRTFQDFLWKDMPGALLPEDPDGGSFYSEEELDIFRLSSKSHWDVPVRVPGGETVHLLASHPTPPGFDGPEERNALRNHDEIRFWGDYISGESYIYDDAGERGGLARNEPFVVLGDLNADDKPGGDEDSDTFEDPVGDFLLSNDRVNGEFVPEATEPDPGLDPDDTADFGIRADYVLPSTGLTVRDGGVYGHSGLYEGGGYGPSPSDHYPVWIDLGIPKN